MVIKSEIPRTYFSDNKAQGALRLVGYDAELRVGYGEINYRELFRYMRLKENVEEINGDLAISIVNSATPISYNFKM